MATQKKSVIKKKTPAQQPTMNPQDAEKQRFVMWLKEKLEIEDDAQLQEKVKQLGEDGMKQVYAQFKQEEQGMQTQMAKQGAKLNRLASLLQFAKGSKMTKDCPTCDKKDMPVKKLKMMGVQTGTADIETTSTKNIEKKTLIKKKK